MIAQGEPPLPHNSLACIKPDWPVADNIIAFTTTRIGFDHYEPSSPFGGFNIAEHVGDDPQAVDRHRQHLLKACEGLKEIRWLDQCHGSDVVDVMASVNNQSADASYCLQAGVACAVMTADCLPVLICDRGGSQVAAVHAGWRGLAGGVIERTIERLKASSTDLLIWLGPAISARHFEVGRDVLDAFESTSCKGERLAIRTAFRPSARGAGYFMADLYQLARMRLKLLGIDAVYGGEHCTYAESEQFYSFRRTPFTGRMVSLIYRKA